MSAMGILSQGLATDPGNIGDTWAQSRSALKTRLVRAALRGHNLHGQQPYKAPPPWQTDTRYYQGNVVRTSTGGVYVAMSTPAGYKSGPNEPSHDGSGGVTNAWDGTASQSVLWSHVFTAPWSMVDDAFAPTVTETRSASLPGGYTSAPPWVNRALLGFRGCDPQQHVASGGVNLVDYTSKSDGSLNIGGGSIVFGSDAPGHAFQVSSSGQGIVVAVNDRLVTMGALGVQPDTNNVGVWGWNIIDFGKRQPRKWEILTGKDTASLYGLAVPAGAHIWSIVDDLYAALMSDSYFDGSAYGPWVPGNVLSASFGRRIGVPNMRRFAKGGTGLTATNGGNYTFRERLPQVIASKPDLGITMGSSNDAGQSYATIFAAATDYLKYWNDNTPAPMFWFGVPPIAAGTYSQLQTVDGAIADACAAQGAIFESLMAAPMPLFTHGANNAGITWSNNSTIYLGGDLTHPVDKGTMYTRDVMVDRWFNSMLPRLAA
ncbi:hypothetical protein [Xanthobacter aminoxidans]|uniref:SGNH hydrolase-type esterase domain-containing protein n=1 Tax=Xanthobacter aminoxidans TaxID=186280 RepID=A0ABW6ZA13_9HYPH